MRALRNAAALRTVGVRFVYDPCHGAHGRSAVEFLPVEQVDAGPVLSTLRPIVALLAHDTLYFGHRDVLDTGGLVSAKLRHADHTATLEMWGQSIPLLCVAPPHPFQLHAYLTAHVFGCECHACRRRRWSRPVCAIANYMGAGV